MSPMNPDFGAEPKVISSMQRDLKKMTDTNHDLLIVGGGICGSTIAWDAALRGLKVALVEKKDFSHATSAASTKLIHGGLRYLANFEFGLIREALRERRNWEIIAPHMVDPLPFLIPNYGTHRAKWYMRLGLTLYDLLSFDRGWLEDTDKRLPAHKKISKEKTLSLAPGLDDEGLLGGTVYYDCQMYSPERLGLECLLGAAYNGAQVANYAQVVEFTRSDETRVSGVVVEDRLTGDQHNISAEMTINASGPWADFVLRKAEGGTPSKHLVRSKGIHIITRALTHGPAMTLTAGEDHLFITPWRGHSILGTTDTIFKGDPDDVRATEEDIAIVLKKANIAYPRANLTRKDVIHCYAGLRPLVDTDNDPTNNDDTYGMSRAAEIVDHEDETNLKGLISAIGGKWTTSRDIAERVVDKVIEKRSKTDTFKPCATNRTPLYAGHTGPFRNFVETLKATHPNWHDTIIENLARNYGSHAEDLIALANEEPSLSERLCDQLPDIAVEIVYAVRHEMAQTLEDVVFRRTGIGTLGHPGKGALEKTVVLMSELLGWSDETCAKQLKIVEQRFAICKEAEPTKSDGEQ